MLYKYAFALHLKYVCKLNALKEFIYNTVYLIENYIIKNDVLDHLE